MDLQAYIFTIQHIGGSDNPANILSRQPLDVQSDITYCATESFINSLIANAVPKAMTFSEILEASRADPTLLKIGTCLQESKWQNDDDLQPYSRVRNQLSHKSGIILKDTKIVFLKSLMRVIKELQKQNFSFAQKSGGRT